jgi:hypothetical protein
VARDLRVAFGLWVWGVGYGLRAWVVGYGLRAVGYGFGAWFMGCGLWVTGLGHGLRTWAWVSVALACVSHFDLGCAYSTFTFWL